MLKSMAFRLQVFDTIAGFDRIPGLAYYWSVVEFCGNQMNTDAMMRSLVVEYTLVSVQAFISR